MTKGIVYYTDSELVDTIARPCRRQLRDASAGLFIASVSLGESWWFPPPAIQMNYHGARGYLTMFNQILTGLEALTTDVAFLCEHDCLYHPSHFEFTPPRDDVYYYNVNTWKVDAQSGRAITYVTKQTSGLCANRTLLIEHYRKRIARVAVEGFSRRMGFEPGSHNRPERIDDIPSESWLSAVPNIDIRHSHNLTENRWSPTQFRTPPVGWEESDRVPGWGVTNGRFREFLADLGCGAEAHA